MNGRDFRVKLWSISQGYKMAIFVKHAKYRNVHRATCFLSILLLVLYYIIFTGQIHRMGDGSIFGGRLRHNKMNATELQDARDGALAGVIEALQEATRLAAGGEDESLWFTAEAKENWNRENPCLSRTELRPKYKQRGNVPYVAPNPQWQEVLSEYSKLHRTCMHRIGDPTAYFLSKNASVNCKFTIVDTEEAAGLGNRMVMIASAFSYALVTQRVLLIARGILPPDLVCQPFEGSSWLNFDPGYVVTPFRYDKFQYWNKSGSFHSRIDTVHNEHDSVAISPIVSDYAVANGEGGYTEQVDSRFFCDTEQEYYKKVPWVYIMGCLYFTPKLYAVPSFRPVLDALFPNRMALTNILRDVMPPSDNVWARVKRIEMDYGLQGSNRRLGIQVRYRYLAAQYERMHRDVEDRILRCATENDLLPPVEDPALAFPTDGSNRTVASVFVASLFEGVKNNLSATFGERVDVIQISHEGEQKYGVGIFQEALAEVLTLSFSDSLFVTPQSTFSGVAQGYGGLVPWFIEFREDNKVHAPCTRGQTIDVCFQVPYDSTFRCPHDPAVHNYEISRIYPDIQPCLDADTPGLQLITDSR